MKTIWLLSKNCNIKDAITHESVNALDPGVNTFFYGLYDRPLNFMALEGLWLAAGGGGGGLWGAGG